MTDCALVTLQVIENPPGLVTVQVLNTDSPVLQVELQTAPAQIDITVGGGGDGGDADVATIQAIAAGSTLGLQQELLANDGQAAKTILAVGTTNTGRVQGVSLGVGNVVEAYASGEHFQVGNVLYREFMEYGEPICFTGLSDGAIITSNQGFYGVSEQVDDGLNEYGPMPLFSYGLSFEFTFLYGFRDFGFNDGLIHVVNGPLANQISLTLGDGTVVRDQQNIPLAPWEKTTLSGDGDQEYILRGTSRMMAGTQSAMLAPQFMDNRLIMPLTNDGITWPRRGFASAPFENTLVDFYVRDGDSGSLNDGNGVSPGSPVDLASNPPIGTGANNIRYVPDGATRFRARGLISAFSGADGSGGEATPLMPVNTMAQVTAQPFHIGDVGTGDDSGIALASCYECRARIYEFEPATSELILKYDVGLTRNGVELDAPAKQYHPAAATISNDTSRGAIELLGPLRPGIVVSTSPVMVIAQNGDLGLQPAIRSQNGTTITSIKTSADETLMLGWTPDHLRAQITTDENGFLRQRSIDGNGAELWTLA